MATATRERLDDVAPGDWLITMGFPAAEVMAADRDGFLVRTGEGEQRRWLRTLADLRRATDEEIAAARSRGFAAGPRNRIRSQPIPDQPRE